MNNSGFGDYMELIPLPDENIANGSEDDNIPIGIPDIKIQPWSSDIFWAKAESEAQNKSKEPKKENIEDVQPNFVAAPSFLQNFDPNALPGLVGPSSGSPGPQFPNFCTSTNSIADFGISQLAPLGNTTSHNVITPVDVRKLLGSSQRASNGPVDIRTLAGANRYMSGGLSNKKRGRASKWKTAAGLPSNVMELGVSERLTKLERLSRKSDKDLTTLEKAEKKTILRMEKNRRAAAISRERKKRYIKSLEERNMIMLKHIEALERENSKLRTLLSQRNGSVNLPPRLPSLELWQLTDMSREQKTPRRMIKKERNETDSSNLYLSDLWNPSRDMNLEGTLEMPPLRKPSDVRKSKRLRLL